VMDLLGSSIRSLWWQNTRGLKGFPAATALTLAVRMLGLLESLHKKGFLHRDVKLANFVMSGEGGKGQGKLCLIDFGITVPFEEEQAKAQKTKGSSLFGPQFFGSQEFASRAAHRGDAQSYGDDLESLVYVLAFMLQGALPWSEFKNSPPDVAGEMKRAAVEAIIAGNCEKGSKWISGALDGPCGAVIKELLTYLEKLEFGERPDYAYCRNALMKTYSAETGRDQLVDEYEWSRPSALASQPPRSSSASCVDFLDLF